MDVQVAFTGNSVREAGKLTRSWWGKSFRAVRNIRAMIYMAILLWVACDFIIKGLRSTPADHHSIGTGLAMFGFLAVLVALFFWRMRRQQRKDLAAQEGQSIRLNDSGVTMVASTGATTFEPWAAYSSFQQGKYIVRLDPRTEGKQKAPTRAIPIDTLSPAAAGELRSVLLNHLPERT